MRLTLNQVQRALAAWDPQQDTILMQPEVTEPNYWVGCASGLVEDDRVLVTFRRRRPRGSGMERGWQIGVAELGLDLDPTSLREILTIHKNELDTSSMERACLILAPTGGYELYFSYVDPADNRWRVDVVGGGDVADLDVADRKEVFTAASTGTEGVKDPRVVRLGGQEFMLLSVAHAKTAGGAGEEAHASRDIYNTDQAISLTSLARRGEDGAWEYLEPILTPPAKGWDSNVTRLGSVLPVAEGYLGFYDGERSWEHNYEELPGLALSADLHRWERLTVDGPYKRGGGVTDSIRYIDAVEIDDVPHLLYELTRTDGSHDLRVHRLEV